MKKILLVVLVSGLCAASTVFCAGTKAYKSPLFNFMIDYPSDWEVREFSGIVAFVSPAENRKDRFRENVNVLVENIGNLAVTSEQHLTAGLDAWQRQAADLKVLAKSKAHVGGMDAAYFVGQDSRAKYKQYSVVHDGKVYVLIYTATPDSYDRFLKEAEGIISSFKIE